MRIFKILAIGVMAACAVASSTEAGSGDRNPNNGDELIGYVNGGNGSGAQIATGMASLAARMLGVNIPGIGNQSSTRYQQPSYQQQEDYRRDPGAPAYDLYADCRYGNGTVDRACVKQVNRKLTQAAKASGEVFICEDEYGNRVRTQRYSYGCRLESKMRGY